MPIIDELMYMEEIHEEFRTDLLFICRPIIEINEEDATCELKVRED